MSAPIPGPPPRRVVEARRPSLELARTILAEADVAYQAGEWSKAAAAARLASATASVVDLGYAQDDQADDAG